MKRIIFFLLTLALVFQGCEKDVTSWDTSKITNFANLELLGDVDLIVPQGSAYTELGVFAEIDGQDVKDQVTVSGSVDVNTAGYYPLTYSVANADGFSKTVTRNVFVIPSEVSATDVSGVYTGLRVGKTPVDQGCTITKLADGFYFASDFFGGYYEFVAGYGAAYRLGTYFILNADNSINAISNDSPWGPWPVKEGVFNPDTNVFNFQVWNGTFYFDVVLTKE